MHACYNIRVKRKQKEKSKMSRQITEEAVSAFETGKKFCKSNTTVTSDGKMYLFGNKIAEYVDGVLQVSMCGYNTVTTRERLNGLTGVSATTKRGIPYINGEEVSSCGVYGVRIGQPLERIK